MNRKRKSLIKAKNNEVCFVIMPYGDWFDDYYEEIFCPAIKAAGLEPHRADDIYAPNTVVSDIWDYTQRAKIVLADLTGKNPNVFYEMGLAHAIHKPVILLTANEEDVPFDLRAIRFLKYDKNEQDWGYKLKQSIQTSIKEILKDPEKSIPATFLKIDKSAITSGVTPTMKEIVEIRQDVELLKKEIQSVHRVPDRRLVIGPDEARSLIKNYIDRDMPTEMIVDRLMRLGPPKSWILRRIEEFKSQKN